MNYKFYDCVNTSITRIKNILTLRNNTSNCDFVTNNKINYVENRLIIYIVENISVIFIIIMHVHLQNICLTIKFFS